MANSISKRNRNNSGNGTARSRARAEIANSRNLATSAAGENRTPRRVISVFGSSRAQEGSELYTEALRVGRLLGQSGFDVMTGGYSGVMEAASRGAHETGAHVIGIAMRVFGETVNPYVIDEVTVRDFPGRLRQLVDMVDGYVVMRGGMGTLAELTWAWQKLWLKMLPARPFVLLGHHWRRVLDSWLENLIVDPTDYKCMTLVDTPEQASAFLTEYFSRPSAPAPLSK